MYVSVKMSAEEFLAFRKWQRDRSSNTLACFNYIRQLQALASLVLLTFVGRGQDDSSEYRISSQGCAENLCAMAQDVLS